jgi:CAAX prenyl protease N-terminal, five membrane helices
MDWTNLLMDSLVTRSKWHRRSGSFVRPSNADGGIKMIWSWSLSLSEMMNVPADAEITQSLIFAAVFGLFNLGTNLPFSLYYNFVIGTSF